MSHYYCSICNFTTNLKNNYQRHIKTKKHMKNDIESGVNYDDQTQNETISNTNTKLSNTNTKLSNTNHQNDQKISNTNTKLSNTNTKLSNTDVTLGNIHETQSNNNKICNTLNYICKYCNKEFSKNQSYYRHMKHYCKKKQSNNKVNKLVNNNETQKTSSRTSIEDNNNDISIINLTLKEPITSNDKNEPNKEIIPSIIEGDMTNNSHSHNTTNNTNNTNTSQSHNTANATDNSNNKTIDNSNNKTINTIVINHFGGETTEHITNDFKYKMLKNPYDMIPKLVSKIHFSDEAPKNKNIELVNKRDEYIKIHAKDGWTYKEKDDVLFDLVDSKYYFIDNFYEDMITEHAEEFRKNMTEYEENTYLKFQEKFDAVQGNKPENEFLNKLKLECFYELILCKELEKNKIRQEKLQKEIEKKNNKIKRRSNQIKKLVENDEENKQYTINNNK
jgi:hypothetical protein